jgi:hypothetical protein
MLHLLVALLLIVVFNDVCLGIGWNPSNFSFNPSDNYELVWQDEFENVGPIKAIINGKPAYSPNPKNWAHAVGPKIDGGIQNYTASIQNSYVQDNQLRIVAMKEGNASAMLTSENLQEFTFGIWAAKIRLPYGQGMWPAWWLVGNGMKYGLHWPTVGGIDILEMVGGTKQANSTDQYAHGTVHWNNQSNTMNPVYNKYTSSIWRTPDGSMQKSSIKNIRLKIAFSDASLTLSENVRAVFYLARGHLRLCVCLHKRKSFSPSREKKTLCPVLTDPFRGRPS